MTVSSPVAKPKQKLIRPFFIDSTSSRIFIFGVVTLLVTLGGVLFELGLGWMFYANQMHFGFQITDTLSFGFGFAVACFLLGAYVQFRLNKARLLAQKREEAQRLA